MEQNPKVFISYSHDSVTHGDEVLRFSNRLRSEGIDCSLDQYEESPPEGWPRWMDAQIRNADFVLMVCSDLYRKKVEGEVGTDVGLGVKWEGNLIYQYLYDSGAVNKRFVPVLFADGQIEHIPRAVRGSTHYRVSNQVEYDRLYWRLRGQSKAVKPGLGTLRSLPERRRKTNPGAFLTGFIDVTLWGPAKWSGIFYVHDNVYPPYLALLFTEETAAKKIFTQWHERLGRTDRYEELRIAIVEGDVPGEEPGYSVHITANIEAIYRRADDLGLNIPKDLVMIISRLHRMNPPPGSPNLAAFKQQYQRFGCYQLCPAVMAADGVRLFQGMAIQKREIAFRNAIDIQSINDPDSAVIKKFCKQEK